MGFGQMMLLGAGALGLGVPNAAYAVNLYSGTVSGQDLEINLETTAEYSNFFRVNRPSAVLKNYSNGNEGDEDFQHGLVSNLFSVVPVLDIAAGNFGAHFSGEAYLNTSYLGKNQNDSPSTFNPVSPASNRDFTSATRNVNGENAKLLDAFVYGTKYFGADQGQELTVKVGRSTLIWGQSLFFSGNGISAGMAPIDAQLATSLPNAQTQQILLPVGQAVVTYQPNQTLTFQGYYQFEWEKTNLQGVGAYFSTLDMLDKGGQRIIYKPGLYLYRAKDLQPHHNPQFGLSVEAVVGSFDLGLYGLRYDQKTPQLTTGPAHEDGSNGPGDIGSYWLVYPRDIQVYGGSFSTLVGPANVAGEISSRRNMPLVSNSLSSKIYPGTATGPGSYGAKGTTLAGQISATYSTPGLTVDPGGISFAAEYAMNHVLSVDQNRSELKGGRNGTAGQFQMTATPTYFNVLPNLQLSFPVGFTFNLFGRSQIDSTENHGTGSVNVGITATYRSTWVAALTYKDYLGAPAPSGTNDSNPLADRGYVSFNIQHTF